MDMKQERLQPCMTVIDYIPNEKFKTEHFIEKLIKSKELVVVYEEKYNFKTQLETIEQYDLALEFIKELHFKNIVVPHEFICCVHNQSLVNVLLLCFMMVQGKKNRTVTVRENRKLLMEFLLPTINKGDFSSGSDSENYLNDFYTTMIITNQGDLEAATDVLAKSFNFNSNEWIIRNVYVQEMIFDKFTTLLAEKLEPFDPIYTKDKNAMIDLEKALTVANKMKLNIISNPNDKCKLKPSIIIGSNRSFFDQANKKPSLMIVANKFRTLKEVINFTNKDKKTSSVTIWSKNIDETYEMMNAINYSTIWINCHGKFNAKFPFNFNELSLYYSNVQGEKINSENADNEMIGHENFAMMEFKKNLHFQCFSDENLKSKNKFHKSDEFIFKKLNDRDCLEIDRKSNEMLKKYNCNFIGSNYKIIVTQFGVTFAN